MLSLDLAFHCEQKRNTARADSTSTTPDLLPHKEAFLMNEEGITSVKTYWTDMHVKETKAGHKFSV